MTLNEKLEIIRKMHIVLSDLKQVAIDSKMYEIAMHIRAAQLETRQTFEVLYVEKIELEALRGAIIDEVQRQIDKLDQNDSGMHS